jgi:O-6-methylguanine DNA methyltransferase
LQRIELLPGDTDAAEAKGNPARTTAKAIGQAHIALAALAEGKGITIPEWDLLRQLISLQGLTPFAQSVLRQTAAIPRARVVSYGDIAKGVDRPGAARAVGRVQGQNPFPLIIPCHRVVRGDGSIGHYGAGTQLKGYLLSQEGVPLFHNYRRWA